MTLAKSNDPHTVRTVSFAMRYFILALAVAFLIGLVPMWLLAYSRGTERDTNAQRVTRLQLKNEISIAALHAKRGEYEAARQHASTFFTRLRSAIDDGDALNGSERDAVRPLLSQRDDVITLLARNDPASVDRLFGVEYRLNQEVKPRD